MLCAGGTILKLLLMLLLLLLLLLRLLLILLLLFLTGSKADCDMDEIPVQFLAFISISFKNKLLLYVSIQLVFDTTHLNFKKLAAAC